MQYGLVLIFSLFGVLGVRGGQPVCLTHGHHFQNCVDLIDNAIVDVDLYYDTHLCQSMININCDDHHITGDEVLCGTDGKTYDNHCLFSVARCRHMLNDNIHMNIANVGVCPATIATTKPTPGPTDVGTQSVTMVVVTGSGSTAQLIATQPSGSPVSSTPDPVHNVIANTFCQQVGNVDCNTGFNVVCGSDGQFYPNDCELSKAKCLDTALTKVDFSNCST